MKLKNLLLKSTVFTMILFVMSGCTALHEGYASQMEIPSLENQANRVAVGMTIVRQNNIMAFKMPISADAKWPSILTQEITDADERFIKNVLMDDPYFATAHYTKAIQRKMLGSSKSMSSLGQYANLASAILDKSVTPLTLKTFKKLDIFYNNPDLKPRADYGSDQRYYEAVRKNYPNIFEYDSSLDSFLDFKSGVIQEIDSPTGDIYESVGEALISLTPISLQKDLLEARLVMLEGFEDVASLTLEKGQLQNDLKTASLNNREKLGKQKELLRIETQIEEAKSVSDEKEVIYYHLLDSAVLALESDINIADENYVNLAKNIHRVSLEIQSSSLEAYTAFALAIANIASSEILQKFPKELESLAIAKVMIPANLQDKYNTRLKRVAMNSVYLIPNALLGTYYAYKQSSLAQKYASVTDVIILAAKVKCKQDAAQVKSKS